jgi:hypothetical protein
VVVVAAAAAAGAFGLAVFLAAKAPEVETAKIARPTRIIFFMFSSPLIWKQDAPAVEHSKLECYALGMTFPICERPASVNRRAWSTVKMRAV